MRGRSVAGRSGGFRALARQQGTTAWQRLATSWWPLLQATAAGTAAWVIAVQVFDHRDPFFAPISAVVALNATLGQRGLNALRLLLGVVVGIVVGELTIWVAGGGWASLAVAIFVAMAVARAIGEARIVIAQAAVAAILIVALGDATAGVDRLADALLGAGVALVTSQLLFPPEPVALVRRAAAAALTDMAEGLRMTARSLGLDDAELDGRALDRLRDMRDRLVELNHLRLASGRVVRHTLIWRSRTATVVRESENAAHLDLLGGSCLMLARTALAARPAQRRQLARHVQDLADLLARLADNPGGDRQARQHAAEGALDIIRRLAAEGAEPADTAAPVVALQIAATDTMVFAGADPHSGPGLSAGW